MTPIVAVVNELAPGWDVCNDVEVVSVDAPARRRGRDRMTSIVRIAAVGDIHVGLDTGPVLGPPEQLAEAADLLLVAGDLTRRGTPAEAEVLAAELRQVPVPVIAILGNHDYESDAADDVRDIIAGAGATVLDGDSATMEWATSASASPAHPASAAASRAPAARSSASR